MKFWLDAHLSPKLCGWLSTTFAIEARSAHELGMHEADDDVIFEAARVAGVDVVVTKDRDFVDLIERLVPHPKSSGSQWAIHPPPT